MQLQVCIIVTAATETEPQNDNYRLCRLRETHFFSFLAKRIKKKKTNWTEEIHTKRTNINNRTWTDAVISYKILGTRHSITSIRVRVIVFANSTPQRLWPNVMPLLTARCQWRLSLISSFIYLFAVWIRNKTYGNMN